MAPFEMLWIPVEFIFRSSLGVLLMMAMSMGLLKVMVWREQLLAKEYPSEDKLRGSQIWSYVLVTMLVASGCAYFAVRMM